MHVHHTPIFVRYDEDVLDVERVGVVEFVHEVGDESGIQGVAFAHVEVFEQGRGPFVMVFEPQEEV